jgi:uncharacterized NAD(P)/FAD-binding protein YdhS
MELFPIMPRRIAIIGFGFGGLMVLANLVRAAKAPMHVTIVAPDARGIGLAYGTHNPLHLLNVPARNMSAFAHDNAHFIHWLQSPEAAAWLPALERTSLPGEADFAPRMLYGHYLSHVLEATVTTAAHHAVTIEWVHGIATGIAPEGDGWRIDAGGQQVIADRVVIATGNEVKPIFPALVHPAIIENPWLLTQEDAESFGTRPLVMIGTGLTSVDIVLTLRRMGYAGTVHAISRNGMLPLPHRPDTGSCRIDTDALFAQPNLLALLRFVRAAIRAHERQGGDWRAVIDALRPHAIRLWQQLSAADQRSFIRRLATLWNSHRHRMAPDIAAIMAQEITAGKLRLGASHHFHPSAESGELKMAVQWLHGGSDVFAPAAILNCTGPELNWSRSVQPLLHDLLRGGHVAAHPTGVGVVADGEYRIGNHLYAIGNPMTGQFWESTAVPELRQQAAAVGEALCR